MTLKSLRWLWLALSAGVLLALPGGLLLTGARSHSPAAVAIAPDGGARDQDRSPAHPHHTRVLIIGTLAVPPPQPSSPAPVAPPPRPAPPPIWIGSVQQRLINADRAGAGLAPLTWSPCLARVAVQNAQRMAAQGYISHAKGVYQDLACGLSSRAGENIGYWSGGINDPQLNTMFMNSPEHRANILGYYRYVGTGWAVAPNGYGYIAVEFS